MNKHIIVAVSGGSGSGKTTLARKLQSAFAQRGCEILGQDSYYIDQSSKFDKDGGAVNFDHPNALEFTLMAKQLENLKNGHDIQVPTYDFATHTRSSKTHVLHPTPVILVDGILILSQEVLRPLFDESIFLEVDEETRFQRRLRRDVQERGRTPEGVHDQFYKQVKVMHDQFVEPSIKHATIVVDQGRIIVQKPNASAYQSVLLETLKTIL